MIMEAPMTLEFLIFNIAGGILSLLQELVDWFWPWLDKQSDVIKRLVALGINAIAALVVFGLACGGVLNAWFPDVALTCDQNGVLLLVGILIAMLTGNQITHLVIKKSG